MIAGVTHLTMEADLARGVELGASLGFQLSFRNEVELPAGFEGIEDGASMLPLALLQGLRGIRLEVVQHQRQTGLRGAYTGVFRCSPPVAAGPAVSRPELSSILRQADLLLDPTCVAMTTPSGEAWFESSSPGGGLAGIVCRVSDVRAEAGFWAAFARTRWDAVGADAAWGSVPSPLPQAQCRFVIVRAADAPRVYAMNDSGFPSIGVISTSIERDCDKAVAVGAVLRSGPVTTTVGGRSLRMALISTPGGAPVELLAVHRSAAAAKQEAEGS